MAQNNFNIIIEYHCLQNVYQEMFLCEFLYQNLHLTEITMNILDINE